MTERARYLTLAASLGLLLPSLSLAVTGENNRKSFEISRTDTPPVIDGPK